MGSSLEGLSGAQPPPRSVRHEHSQGYVTLDALPECRAPGKARHGCPYKACSASAMSRSKNTA